MFFEICNSNYYIATAGTRLGIVENVFAERRELESPFRGVVPTFTRAFLLPKISGSNRFFPDSLKRWIENGYYKNRLSDRLRNLNLETRVKKRDQGLFSSCELTSITKRLIVGEGNISTRISYMDMVL